MANRNTEIWATRLQREILALESSDDESKKIELLPPFIKTIGHTLSIEGGIAKIEFRIDVELDEAATRAKNDVSAGEVGGGATEAEVAATDENEGKDGAQVSGSTGSEEQPLESENSTGNADADTEPGGEDTADPHVVLVLDASMYWTPDSANSHKSSPQSYPFQKPIAIIKSGSYLFSGGSTIRDGDEVQIDLDWTPSIHLSDAATNVALKVRECVRIGEPLHPARKDEIVEEDGISGSILREAREAKETLLETKKVVASMFSSGLSSLTAKGSSASKTMSKGLFSLGESLSSYAEGGSRSNLAEDDSYDDATREEAPSPKEEVEKVVKDVPDIGDEINLSDEPWNQCIGMYSCKAIKRPAFIDDAIAEASKPVKEVSRTGSMFSRFAQSAKSVMEESFLMITDKSIVEFKANRLNVGSGTVTFAIKIDEMAKLKFRREESLSLFFKRASDDPLVYMCLDSALAVQDIQNVLKRHGVKGKHSNAATQRAVQMALNLVALIQQKEKELIDNPTVDRVNEIMDLYRQSAEKFEVAGDPRHAEVLAHMKRFLNQQFTSSILDGTFMMSGTMDNRKADSPRDDPVPQGEILDQPTYNLSNDDDDDDDVKETSTSLNDSTLQSMENMLSEAVKDMSDFGVDDDDINEILTSPTNRTGKDDLADHDDTYAELDAMWSDADKELDELLNS